MRGLSRPEVGRGVRRLRGGGLSVFSCMAGLLLIVIPVPAAGPSRLGCAAADRHHVASTVAQPKFGALDDLVHDVEVVSNPVFDQLGAGGTADKQRGGGLVVGYGIPRIESYSRHDRVQTDTAQIARVSTSSKVSPGHACVDRPKTAPAGGAFHPRNDLADRVMKWPEHQVDVGGLDGRCIDLVLELANDASECIGHQYPFRITENKPHRGAFDPDDIFQEVGRG